MKNLVSWLMIGLLCLALTGCGSTGGNGGSVTTTGWGESGTGDGQFDDPHGIALDGDGNVYVSDRDNNRIQKFTKNGEFIKKWDFTPGTSPWGLVVNNERLYVCDGSPSPAHVRIFDLEGNYVESWAVPDVNPLSGNPAPVDIDVDNADNLYVLDNINRAVIKYDSSGEVLSNFRVDREDVTVWGPNGIAIYGDYAFVTDSSNHRVDRWNLTDGSFSTSWGSEGSTDGKFYAPIGIAIQGTASVLVGDLNLAPVFARVQKFDFAGTFQGKISSSELGAAYPVAIAVNNSAAKIYICDQGGDRILVQDTI